MFFSNFRSYITHFSYGFGSIPYGATGSIIGFYFTIFLLETVNISPALVSIIVFGGRLWDAITDPIIGYLILFTPFTCLGRLKPWIISGIIPMSIFYFLLWQVFSFSSSIYSFFYYFVIYLLFETFTTVYHLPFAALIVSLSDNLSFRDSATLFRMFFEVFGVLLGVGIHTIFLSLSQSKVETCGMDSMPSNTTGFTENSGYFWSSVITSILIFSTCLIMLFGTKEIIPIAPLRNVNSKSKKRFHPLQVYNALTYKPYLYLLGIYMFSWLSVQILQGNFALFSKHVLKMEDDYFFMLLLLVISMIFSMLPWQIFMFKTSKKLTLILGSAIVLISLLILLFLDHHTIVFNYIISFIAGTGVSTFYLVPWSMLPDVVDSAFLSMGIRMEEIFFGFFVFFSKFGSGMALGVSTLVLELVDYNSKECTQSTSVQISIRLLMTAVPFILICFSLLILLNYPINENQRKYNNEQIKLLLENNPEHAAEQTEIFSNSYNSISRMIESSNVFSKT